MNEGYVGFFGIECICELVIDVGLDFDIVLIVVWFSMVFIIYIFVFVGIDWFLFEMVQCYVNDQCGDGWFWLLFGLLVDCIVVLGVEDDLVKFNMVYMGLWLVQWVNGVLLLYGWVSCVMFNELWVGFDFDEVLIGFVINGVYVFIWVVLQWLQLGCELVGLDFLCEFVVWQ